MPRQPFGLALLEAVAEAAVGHLHDDDQMVLLGLVLVRLQQEGMTALADLLQGLQFARLASWSRVRRMILTATSTPPGAEARQTSPNSPRPSRSSFW